MTAENALYEARLHAEKAWSLFTREHALNVVVPAWHASTAPDGRPTLSAQVAGPGADRALRLFAAQYHIVLGPDSQCPHFDVSTPGRTVVVWRDGGVWVELWHPDTVTIHPAAPSRAAARQGLLSRASGRLPYTRRRKTTPAA